MVFVDCTTEDLKRLDKEVVDLAGEIQKVQMKAMEGRDPRDQMIILETSVRALEKASQAIIKKSASPRFYRSIARAYTLMRSFRVKPEAQ